MFERGEQALDVEETETRDGEDKSEAVLEMVEAFEPTDTAEASESCEATDVVNDIPRRTVLACRRVGCWGDRRDGRPTVGKLLNDGREGLRIHVRAELLFPIGGMFDMPRALSL